MIIDAHVHVIDSYPSMAPYADAGRHDRLLYLMDQCGVDKAVMLPVVAEASPDNNRECADLVRQHPDRLLTLTNVQLHEADAAERVLRVRDEFGAVGTSYYPSTPDLAWMLEPARDALWRAYEATQLVCNLHVTPPNYGSLLALARKHPQIRFVLNHLALPGSLDPDDATYGGLMAGAVSTFSRLTAAWGGRSFAPSAGRPGTHQVHLGTPEMETHRGGGLGSTKMHPTCTRHRRI